MGIFKITLLLKSIKKNKNTKQFLLFINIGIFLSICAISSAIITFYTETKIFIFVLSIPLVKGNIGIFAFL